MTYFIIAALIVCLHYCNYCTRGLKAKYLRPYQLDRSNDETTFFKGGRL